MMTLRNRAGVAALPAGACLLAGGALAAMMIATPGFAGASRKAETLDELAGQTSPSSARFVFRKGERPGVLSLSGHLVCDEALIEGRFVTRYWNPCGQVWPEMHFAGLKWEADQSADSFRLAVNTRSLAGGFEWQGAELCPDPSSWRARRDGKGKPPPVVHSVVSLRHKSAGIAVKVHTRLDGGPFMIRWLEISNLNPSAVALTEVAPFAGMLWNHRYEEHLPAGVATPFAVAYNQMFEWGREGDFHFAELQNGSKIVNGGRKGRSGWGRPAFWARNRCNGQTFVCELTWGGNYEWTLDCRLRDTDQASFLAKLRSSSLFFKMGLSGHDEALRVLDAGWYGKEPNRWWPNVGDWQDGKWMERGGGLKAVADYAHKKGMKFGLWVEIEAAGPNSDLKKNHPDWLLKRDGQPIADGRALDLTLPDVMRFERETITRLIRDLGLDMYRIDHNHTLAPSGNRKYQGYTEDLTWRYYEKLYKDVIRPTMIEGRVFHHTPFLPLEDATPWCVLEYAKADRSTAVAAVFRTSCEKAGIEPDEYVFRPRGIDPSARYRVQLDSRKLGFAASGELLMREGVRIRLEQPQTSELVILRRIMESGK